MENITHHYNSDVFWVRIDKNRKLPITSLIRAMGVATDAEIKRLADSDGDGIPDFYADTWGMTKPGNEYELSTEYTNLEYYLYKIIDNKITKPAVEGGEVLGNEVGKYVMNTTAIDAIQTDAPSQTAGVDVYNLCGYRLLQDVSRHEAMKLLPRGVYIIDGQKVMVQ